MWGGGGNGHSLPASCQGRVIDASATVARVSDRLDRHAVIDVMDNWLAAPAECPLGKATQSVTGAEARQDGCALTRWLDLNGGRVSISWGGGGGGGSSLCVHLTEEKISLDDARAANIRPLDYCFV